VRIAYGNFEFEGDITDFLTLVDISKAVADTLKVKSTSLDKGKSYILEKLEDGTEA
jgi:hypothetical protein